MVSYYREIVNTFKCKVKAYLCDTNTQKKHKAVLAVSFITIFLGTNYFITDFPFFP